MMRRNGVPPTAAPSTQVVPMLWTATFTGPPCSLASAAATAATSAYSLLSSYVPASPLEPRPRRCSASAPHTLPAVGRAHATVHQQQRGSRPSCQQADEDAVGAGDRVPGPPCGEAYGRGRDGVARITGGVCRPSLLRQHTANGGPAAFCMGKRLRLVADMASTSLFSGAKAASATNDQASQDAQNRGPRN
jgi:hypothetical protein